MVEERVQRKLTTIFAADVEGYTRLMRADEEATLGTLAEYREIIDDLIARHNGRVFSTGGDSVLAEFGSPVEAVRCAISIQEYLRVRDAEQPGDRRMRFRIGINVGDVMVRDGDLFGDAVNVAARLEGLAEAGGVCISGSVFEQVKHKLSFGFQDMGAQEVKNIAEPVPAFRVVAGPVSVATPAEPCSAMKRWRMPALAAVVVALIAVGYLVWGQKLVGLTSKAPVTSEQTQVSQGAETVEEFLALAEQRIGEASGAATLNGRIYVVDDEKPYLYEYQYSLMHKKAIFLDQYRIRDARKELGGIKEKHVNNIHDLEGAAVHKGRLYVVTSHSLTQKNKAKKKRELLVEIGKLETRTDEESLAHVSKAASLTMAISKGLDGLKQRKARLIETARRSNIEGFAIDPSGTAHFGFMNPLVEMENQVYALVLAAKLDSVFSGEASFKPILIRLQHSGKSYGIASLEFNHETLFILGNSPKRGFFLDPRLWKLTPTEALIQEPLPVKDWTLKLPLQFQATPEALVLPPNSEKGFIFLDAEGQGGQRVFDRGALGAEPP
jgi:adenylate cyclase